MMKYHFRGGMKSIVLCAFLTFLLGGLIWLPMITISKELEKLNSKIDKIVIFLDINHEEGGDQ